MRVLARLPLRPTDRKDDGMHYSTCTDAGGLLVGDKVTIDIDREAIKQ